MYTPHLMSYPYTVVCCFCISVILYLHTCMHILEVSVCMIALFMVIAGLTLVEGCSTGSEIGFGCGLLCGHGGQLLHGLSGYHLLVGVRVPEFNMCSMLVPAGMAFELWAFHWCDSTTWCVLFFGATLY